MTPWPGKAVRAIERASLAATLVVLLLTGLPGVGAAARHAVLLADPSERLDVAWVHKTFGAATKYERVEIDGRAAIRAEGRQSASGLYREVAYRTSEYPWIEWSWRAARLQSGADIPTTRGDQTSLVAGECVDFGVRRITTQQKQSTH